METVTGNVALDGWAGAQRPERHAAPVGSPPVVQPWVAGPVGGPGAPAGCGCGVTVARWSGRETRALREALRLSVRAFAERLGVACSTVQKWEDWRRPAPPGLAMQSVLDDALRLAGADARTRFGMLVHASPVSGGDVGRGGVVSDDRAVSAAGRGGARLRVAS